MDAAVYKKYTLLIFYFNTECQVTKLWAIFVGIKVIIIECRVLARILKMPVRNRNHKISAHPDLAI